MGAAKALGIEMGKIIVVPAKEENKELNISNKQKAKENILEKSMEEDGKEPEQSTDESTEDDEDDEEDITDADELHKSSVEVASKDETDDFDLLYPSGLVGTDSEKREYGDEMETAGESNETLMEEDSQETSKEFVEGIDLEGQADIGELDENDEESETDDGELGSLAENSLEIVSDIEKIEQLKIEMNKEIEMPSNLEVQDYKDVKQEYQQEVNRSIDRGLCPCPVCEYNPGAPAKLKEHLAQKHFAERIKAEYVKEDKVCPIDNCEKEFANPGSLVRHIGSTHGKVKAPICSILTHPIYLFFSIFIFSLFRFWISYSSRVLRCQSISALRMEN